MPAVERHVRVHRTARFFQLGTPNGNTRELWVACHGYGQLAAPFAAALEPLNDGRRVIVTPEALSRFYLDDPAKRHGPTSPVGATWMTREDREWEIADYVEYLDVIADTMLAEIAGGTNLTLVALGFSQGVATVARWAALGRTPIARLVLWGGTPPNDLPSDRGARVFRAATVTVVGGRTDALVPVSFIERETEKLRERGIPVALVMHDGAHALNSATLRAIAHDQ